MADWDDGKHEKVKKVKITYQGNDIYSLQVDYCSSGSTVHGEVHGKLVGSQSAEFELNADEYLTEVNIYEFNISASFTFKSNQRSFGPYGNTAPSYHHREIKSPEGNHIVGFHGKSDNYLTRLDVHFGPIDPSGAVKLDAQGGKEGQIWDDGSNHDDVSNIMVGVGHKGIHYVKFDYDKSGVLNDAPTHGLKDETFSLAPFKIDRPNEYLVSVEGYYNVGIINGLQFLTNQRVSQVFGYSEGTKFTLEVKNRKIVGFHGYADMTLNSLGAYFVPISSASSPSTKKLEAQGSKGGKQWDDGADHNAVTKIVAGFGRKGVHYIKFAYNQSKELKDAPMHGLTDGTLSPPYTFDIDYPNEYLVSVFGYYEGDNILGLRFKTSKRESQVLGYWNEGTMFTLEVRNMKIVGFHGYADTTLKSLGAYFVPIPPSSPSSINKLEVQGWKGGKEWDDVADHDGVRNIVIGVGKKGVHYIKFDYHKSGQLKDGQIHGLTNGTLSPPPTFDIDQPDEYIVSLEGYYNNNIIQGLQVKTNKRNSQVIGYRKGTKFTLEVKDKKIVGFHGYAETYLNSIGAYFAPTSSSLPSSVNKLEAQGGKGETTFDDGAFDGVRKIYIGQGDSGVTYVEFEYENNVKLESRAHGKKGKLGAEEFELELGEYITSVEGYYEKVYPYTESLISALIFKTSKGRTSAQFGVSSNQKFELDGKGGKLVGFHGSIGEVLHSLGAYFASSTPPFTPGSK